MAEEVIVTKFTADLTNLEAGISTYEKSLNSAAGTTENLGKSQNNLSGATGKLSDKFDGVRDSATRANQGISTTVKAVDDLRARIATLQKQKAALIDPKAIASTNKQIAGLQAQVSKLDTAGVKSKGTFGGLFSTIGQGASQAVPGIGGITGAFSGLSGIIGLAATAVVGFIANFSRLDSVQIALDAISIRFDQVGNRLTSFEGIKGLFDPKTQQADAAIAAFRAKLLDDLQANQRDVNLSNAEAEQQLTSLSIKLKDVTLNLEERKAIGKELQAVEEGRAAKELDLANERLGISNAAILDARRQKIAQSELSDEILDQQNAAQVAIVNAETAKIQVVETAQRRINLITEQGEAERSAAVAKGAAAREKIAKDQQQRELEIAAGRGAVDKALEAATESELALKRTEAEQEVAVTTKKFEDLVKATQEGYEKIRAASPPGDASRLAAEEAAAVLSIDRAKNAELAKNAADALADQRGKAKDEDLLRRESLDSIREALNTEVENQSEAINVKFDDLEDAAIKTIGDEEELNAVLIELAKVRYGALKGLRDTAEEEEREKRNANIIATTQAVADGLNQIQEIINAGFDKRIENNATKEQELQDRLSEAKTDAEKAEIESAIKVTQAQGEQLEKQRKQAQGFAVAAALVNTFLGAQLAFTSQFIPADPSTLPRAILAAAIATATGLLNVAKIRGAYTGERNIGEGEAPIWSGKDGYLRRVHRGEDIIASDKTKKYRGELDAIHKGKLEGYIREKYMPSLRARTKGANEYRTNIQRTEDIEVRYLAPIMDQLNHRDDAKVNDYVSSDTGQRIASSVMLAKFYDANIVAQLARNGKQDSAQTELLSQLVANTRPVSRRYR